MLFSTHIDTWSVLFGPLRNTPQYEIFGPERCLTTNNFYVEGWYKTDLKFEQSTHNASPILTLIPPIDSLIWQSTVPIVTRPLADTEKQQTTTSTTT